MVEFLMQMTAVGQRRLWPAGWWHSRCTLSSGKLPMCCGT